VKWTTALKTLEDVADRCAHMQRQPEGIVRLRVAEAWVFGDLLGPRRDDLPEADGVQVALVTNAAEEDSAAGTLPPAAGHWLAASGLETKPVVLWFRSDQAPVWNHVVDRPVRFWTAQDGLDHDVLVQLRGGDGESLRPPAPSPAELHDRLVAERRVGVEALRRTANEYDEKRWSPGSPKKRGDALADAALGLLAVEDALERVRATLPE
jgi:hypothetical protein